MLTYKQYEKKVYDWMNSKNNSDSTFTFSTRRKATKGSELDYFIGTEKSGYFGMTFWFIPVGFPGSSGDLIDVVFQQKDNGFKFFFEFRQTMTPDNGQNESALNLIKNIKEDIRKIGKFTYETTEENKMFIYSLGSPKLNYDNIENLFIDLEKTINLVLPIIDKGILDEKKINPNFIAERITNSQFLESQENLKKRFLKYENINNESKVELEQSIDQFQAEVFEKEKKSNLNNIFSSSVNIILYGPPGTGKTHKLKNEYFSNYTLTENTISPEANFEDTISGLTWWQVIALALLEIGTNKVSEILENRWVTKKAQLSESKNVRATIWGTLQMHTIESSKNVAYSQRQVPLIFNKTEDKKWELLESEVKEQAPELYEILDSISNFKPNPKKEIKHYVFTTFHQSFSYEDFIEGIKPVMIEGQESVSYRIENGIFKELCLRAQNDPSNRYAIFIDEINRGNVSQIFGELITLIEPDKRIGAKNEIKVKLPYSKKDFGIPMNVDIIGTMNTADRSIEALDTALRRRFSFVEMMPNESVFSELNFNESYPRKDIMLKINQRIEVLLDRNYTLGHSYFLKNDFKNSFENEIIPLLQEYFYNDYGKIGLVLGKGFVREKDVTAKNDKSIFADFDTKNEIDIIKSYELIPFAEIDFDLAIKTLLA